MDEFNDKAKPEDAAPVDKLPQLLTELYDNMCAAGNTYHHEAIWRAGFHLNTVLPLKREHPRDYWLSGHAFVDIARSCAHDKDLFRIAGAELPKLLFAKQEEILREGMKRFPNDLRIRMDLAEAIKANYDRKEISNHDEAIILIKQGMEIVGPDHNDYEEAEEVLYGIMGFPSPFDEHMGLIPEHP